MFKFPIEIINHIYNFDLTYKEYFNECVKEKKKKKKYKELILCIGMEICLNQYMSGILIIHK